MANSNQAIGLRPYGECLKETLYVAGSTVYPGDTVVLSSDGQVDSSVTAPLLGVALNYATVGQDVMVADSPMQKFIVQADGAIATTDVGQNASLALGTASTLYRISRAYLDQSTLNTTATLAVKILGIAQNVGNSAGAAYNDVVVKINNHTNGSHTGTAGI